VVQHGAEINTTVHFFAFAKLLALARVNCDGITLLVYIITSDALFSLYFLTLFCLLHETQETLEDVYERLVAF
jgi:hypothetical protein